VKIEESSKKDTDEQKVLNSANPSKSELSDGAPPPLLNKDDKSDAKDKEMKKIDSPPDKTQDPPDSRKVEFIDDNSESSKPAEGSTNNAARDISENTYSNSGSVDAKSESDTSAIPDIGTQDDDTDTEQIISSYSAENNAEAAVTKSGINQFDGKTAKILMMRKSVRYMGAKLSANAASPGEKPLQGDCPSGGIQTVGGNANGSCCHFPFWFNGKAYNSCQSSEKYGLWCATTESYDKDAKWGKCVVKGGCETQTVAGNSNGACCSLPFRYRGKLEYSCVYNEGFGHWCGTTFDYDKDKFWGLCRTPNAIHDISNFATYGGNSNGAPCVFPFTWMSTLQWSCVNTKGFGSWCATTNNYTRDGYWANCQGPKGKEQKQPQLQNNKEVCEQETVGGNSAEGSCCKFPFVYKGKWRPTCIETGAGKWCATTTNMDKDKMWGMCKEKGEARLMPMPIPWNIQNGGHYPVYVSVPKDAKVTLPQDLTSTKGVELQISGQFQLQMNGKIARPMSISSNKMTDAANMYTGVTGLPMRGNNDNKQVSGNDNSPLYNGKYRYINTRGGNANGSTCSFPFLYDGEWRYSCVDTPGFGKWCGTTLNYTRDGKWGMCVYEGMPNCLIKTIGGNSNGTCCSMPFKYQGNLQYSCLYTKGYGHWCGTTYDYDRYKTWGNCISASVNAEYALQTTGGNSNGSVCKFPFKYKGNMQMSCLNTTGYGLWCGTTNDYDRDGKWGLCYAVGRPCDTPTVGGNSNGTCCKFPFMFNEKWRYSCIRTEGFGDWCATTEYYHRDQKWGNCDYPQSQVLVTTTGGNGMGLNCKFPFIYQGNQQRSCIFTKGIGLWCGVTENFDRDRQWGKCFEPKQPCQQTVGGNSNGRCCKFPFVYKNQTYDSCIATAGGHWCATTSNFDQNRLWGKCQSKYIAPVMTTGGNSNGAKCVFPFKFQGQNVSSCLETPGFGTWCGTTSDYDKDKFWGLCKNTTSSCTLTRGGNANGTCCSFPFEHKGQKHYQCLTTPGFGTWCGTTSNYTRDGEWGECHDPNKPCLTKTLGGNANGSCCAFPFKWKNSLHYSCIKTEGYGHWCGTTHDYDKDGSWGNCIAASHNAQYQLATTGGNANGSECKFPFKFRGNLHMSCIKTEGYGLWCGTTHDYDKDEKWGKMLQLWCTMSTSNSWRKLKWILLQLPIYVQRK